MGVASINILHNHNNNHHNNRCLRQEGQSLAVVQGKELGNARGIYKPAVEVMILSLVLLIVQVEYQ